MTITRMQSPRPSRLALFAATAITLLWPVGALPAATQNFPTAEAAAGALVESVRSGNTNNMVRILGPAAAKLVNSGDAVQDANAGAGFVKDYDAKHALAPLGDNLVQLVVGTEDWPLPIPIVKQGGGWHFDSAAGAQELVNRRIGRNELLSIRTLLSFGGAEQDYFDRQKESTGTGTYAQRILSSDGETDGLYWPAADGAASSPLGPLVDQAQDEGYPDEMAPDGKPVPYHGYYFRVLKAQGDSATGGARDYMQGASMTGGFAFVAWPAQYGSSGIMSFALGPDDVVFQKDLGPDTAKLVTSINRFDPDLSWARVDVKD